VVVVVVVLVLSMVKLVVAAVELSVEPTHLLEPLEHQVKETRVVTAFQTQLFRYEQVVVVVVLGLLVQTAQIALVEMVAMVLLHL
jgi:hypothetical protein